MTELETLRDAYPDPPAPTAAAREAARTRLTDEIAAGTPSRRGARRFGIVVTAGMAAATVAALAVPLLAPGSAGTPGGGAGGPVAVAPTTDRQPPGAKELLLVAAAYQERAEATSGKYFRISTVAVHSTVRIGSGPGAYRLEQRYLNETWTSARAGGPTWIGGRSLGARPATAADREKWRRAGSPTSWNLGPSDTVDRRDQILTTAPGPGSLTAEQGIGNRFFVLGSRQGLTAEQIRALPADPAALRRYLLTHRPAEGRAAVDEAWLFSAATGLLANAPAPPALRSAALRVIADLPGVRATGRSRDGLGRVGTAITLTEKYGEYSGKVRLLIDPATGRLLSTGIDHRIGGVPAKQGESLVLSSGWTDETPRVPSTTVR